MDVVAALREWEAAILAACPDAPPIPDRPTVPSRKLAEFRIDLLDEEFNEYQRAAYLGDIVGVADGLADMLYVLIGTSLFYGIDLYAAFAEVHRSNMSKICPDGSVIRREDGKILKPPTYSPPNLAAILGIEEAA